MIALAAVGSQASAAASTTARARHEKRNGPRSTMRSFEQMGAANRHPPDVAGAARRRHEYVYRLARYCLRDAVQGCGGGSRQPRPGAGREQRRDQTLIRARQTGLQQHDPRQQQSPGTAQLPPQRSDGDPAVENLPASGHMELGMGVVAQGRWELHPPSVATAAQGDECEPFGCGRDRGGRGGVEDAKGPRFGPGILRGGQLVRQGAPGAVRTTPRATWWATCRAGVWGRGLTLPDGGAAG